MPDRPEQVSGPPPRNVVVTGLGAVAATGVGRDSFAGALFSGSRALGRIPQERQARLFASPAGFLDLPRADLKNWFDPRVLRVSTMTRSTLLATVAAADALGHAGLDDGATREDAGCYVGAYVMPPDFKRASRTAAYTASRGAGGFRFDDSRLDEALKSQSAFDFLRNLPNMPGAHAGIRSQFLGPSNTYLGSQSAGLQALSCAFADLRFGDAEVMLAGGVGAPFEEVYLAWERRRGRLASESPSATHRPGYGTGSVPGEGSAFFVLEAEEHARSREAAVLCRVRGSAVRFIPADAEDAAARRAECLTAAFGPGRPDLILPSLRGVPAEERLEIDAWRIYLRDDTRGPAALSLFGAAGDTSTGAGPLAAAAAALCLSERRVPESPGMDDAGEFRFEADESLAGRTALVSCDSPEGCYAAFALEVTD